MSDNSGKFEKTASSTDSARKKPSASKQKVSVCAAPAYLWYCTKGWPRARFRAGTFYVRPVTFSGRRFMAVVARFYSPQEKPFAVGERALLSEKARHHAGRVIRAVAGDTVALFDGSGEVAAGPIAFEGKDAWLSLIHI